MIRDVQRQILRNIKEIMTGSALLNPDIAAVRNKVVDLLDKNGNYKGAIALLVEHLDTYSSDEESWKELAQLYEHEKLYLQASFCYEECLLISPHSSDYHYLYAQVNPAETRNTENFND